MQFCCWFTFGQIINSRSHYFGKLITGGVGWNKNGGLEKISKINNRGETIILFSRVDSFVAAARMEFEDTIKLFAQKLYIVHSI